MKYGKKLQQNQIHEWRTKYIQYNLLKKQIKRIKSRILSLAAHESYGPNKTIKVDELTDEQQFWELVDQNLKTVEGFYQTQAESMRDQFQTMIIELVREGLISDYVPYRKGKKILDRDIRSLVSNNVEIIAPSTDRAHRKSSKKKKEDSDSSSEESDDRQPETNNRQTTDNNNKEFSEFSEFPLQAVMISDDQGADDGGTRSTYKSYSTTTTTTTTLSTFGGFSSRELLGNEKVNKLLEESSLRIPIKTILVKRISAPKLKPKESRKVMQEFYRGLILLQNYCESNLTGFDKILKKHEKHTGIPSRHNYMNDFVNQTNFSKHNLLNLLIEECEVIYMDAYAHGSRSDAMNQLRIPEERPPTLSLFRFGLFFGISLTLLIHIIYSLSTYPHDEFPRFESIIIVYRMILTVLLLVWAWGVDMFIWTRYGVNYAFIFEFDQRHHFNYTHMFEFASSFTVLWTLSLYLYIIGSIKPYGFEWLGDVPWQLHPLVFLLASLITFIVSQYKGGGWLLESLGRVSLSPFLKVRFRDFFLADQLVSIAIVLGDLQYTLCFFLYDAWVSDSDICTDISIYTRPLLAGLPHLIRIFQCLRKYQDDNNRRQLLNAGKYTTGIVVVILSSLRTSHISFLVLWLISIVFSTAYTFLWDLYCDWNLHPIRLRDVLLYPKRWYYFAIITNLILRLSWALTISPGSIGIVMKPLFFSALLAAVEIARRSQWNLYRLENEQINNVGQFRAVQEIPIPIERKRLRKIHVNKRHSMEPKFFTSANVNPSTSASSALSKLL